MALFIFSKLFAVTLVDFKEKTSCFDILNKNVFFKTICFDLNYLLQILGD